MTRCPYCYAEEGEPHACNCWGPKEAMTTSEGGLVKRLKRIADCDYKEPDPRIGNYYEKDGETIMEAAAAIDTLRAENERLQARDWDLENDALLRENDRLREALEKIASVAHGLGVGEIARAALQIQAGGVR